MLGNKVSQFVKSRYLVAPEGADYVMAKEVPQGAVNDGESSPAVDPKPEEPFKLESEPLVDEVVELDKEFLDYEKSNQGRSYGWWVCLDGQRVATLEYRCLLEDPVYLYSVTVLDDKFLQIDLDPSKWQKPSVTLQSRYAESYIKKGLSMGAVGQKMIVVEELFIPEDYFRSQHKELEDFHHMLLEKAKNKSQG